ncbi:MAG: prolipoprotein diacylglyceryl transferase [Culturomica sp.]|jgi:prolipoprotein diacylglyceryl transferase|nr:prolipoprotein diacylglyceryl transferase [Culturomica sp.]
MLPLFINWDVDPVIFSIGSIKLQYYGVCFVLAFILGYKVEEKMFKSEKLPIEWLDKLWIYVAIGTFAGARLGHCFFYDWAYYQHHILEIILPFRFEPHFEFIGYRGLASHGAAVGILITLWYYSRKVSKKPLLWILDRAVVPVALAAFFIRIGNLMNSEIVGKFTDVPWGFIFVRLDETMPRHPAQLYEALWYLLSFWLLTRIYWKTNAKEKQGFIFGAFLLLIFVSRFLIEFLKAPQEEFEVGMPLDMGQLLSIPLIIAGIYFVWRKIREVKKVVNKK